MKEVNARELRANLKECFERAKEEPLVIKRPHGSDMVLLSMEKYNSLKEEKNNVQIDVEQKVDEAVQKRWMEYSLLIKKRIGGEE